MDEQVLHRTNDLFQSFANANQVQVIGRDQDGRDIVAPVDGMTRLMQQEFEKGVRAGILLVKDLPRASEEFYTSIAKEIREAMEAEQEQENDDEA